jgi:hypothetical protein
VRIDQPLIVTEHQLERIRSGHLRRILLGGSGSCFQLKPGYKLTLSADRFAVQACDRGPNLPVTVVDAAKWDQYPQEWIDVEPDDATPPEQAG